MGMLKHTVGDKKTIPPKTVQKKKKKIFLRYYIFLSSASLPLNSR